MPRKTAQRLYWGTKHPNLPQLDLLEIQKQSYYWFLKEGISQRLEEISPIQDFTGKNWELVFSEHKFGQPKHSPIECSNKGVNYDMPLKGKAILKNKQTGKITEQEVFLGDIPQMTENGTFIINGIERAVVNQLVRSPGIFFQGAIDQATGRMLYNAEVRPMRGSWLEFSIGRNDVTTVRIDRRRKFPATVFLRSLGISQDKEIISLFQETDKDPKHHYIESTIQKDPTKTKEEALIEIYRKIRPGEPAILENAENLLNNMFFSPRRYDLSKIGRFKINKRLNLYIPNTPQNWILNQQDVVALLKYLINLQNGHGKVDDIDHLANRRVRRVGELVSSIAFRAGLLRLERAIKEKMSLVSTDELVTPSNLINARPVIAAINEFFRSNQLSTILDQTNPLSELDNLRRLSVMGQGGISRERASFSIRDINSSQYGRICPVRSPEGPNIGLVTYMTLFSRVNEFGFLEVPYRRIIKPKKGSQRPKISDEIVYLSADDEEEYFITHATINIDKKGFIVDDWVPVRHQGEFLDAPASEVDLIDIVPQQIIGTAASLIPFISHDEANRALMGTHMQCQAVPLLIPHSPIVGTGMETLAASVLGRVIRVKEPGKILFVDANKVVVKTKKGEETYKVEKFKKTAQSTCFSQRPVVRVGQKVRKEDLLIDGPAINEGKLALGQNLLIAYMSYEGLGYEDAIVISDRLVKEDTLTSINIEEYEAAVVDTKLGPEETTRDIPNVGEEALANLDSEGIVVIGAEVRPNDILVGKIAPKGETELTAEERLLRAIFGEKARDVRDTSLRVPHGERGTVIGISVLNREKGDELEPGTERLIKVKVAQVRKVVVGDKLAGRHGNKGVISKIVPQADMPHLADGTPIDIIISPLSVLSRMNLGQLLEAHLGWAADKSGFKVEVPVFEKIAEEKIIGELKKAELPVSGKTILYDGKTGEAYNKPIVVGVAYIMKLIHMVEDKTHARSTGPYSLVTQQPLGGKAQMGGQRLGEMEVWALESHRAAYTLQEVLTVKSDDVVGRARAFEAIVKGVDIPASTVPESFKVLVKELQALGINVIPTGVVTNPPSSPTEEELKEEDRVKKEAEELIEATGGKEIEGSKGQEKAKINEE